MTCKAGEDERSAVSCPSSHPAKITTIQKITVNNNKDMGLPFSLVIGI